MAWVGTWDGPVGTENTGTPGTGRGSCLPARDPGLTGLASAWGGFSLGPAPQISMGGPAQVWAWSGSVTARALILGRPHPSPEVQGCRPTHPGALGSPHGDDRRRPFP